MVQVRQALVLKPDHSIDVDAWIQSLSLPKDSLARMQQAVQFVKLVGKNQPNQYGEDCFSQGLEIAEILASLNFDIDSIIAGLLYSTFSHTDLSIEDIKFQLGSGVAHLLYGLQQLDIMNELGAEHKLHSRQQLDNIRKMFLAMVSDVRVVVLKLVERLSIMRAIRHFDDYTRYQISQETMAIFAPLANRLGLYHLKWELEDLAFHDLDPKAYAMIAKKLAERRIDREKRVEDIKKQLNTALTKAGIVSTISGRAKHIYSIHKKMVCKNLDYAHIFDALALRILVNDVQECYQALSIVQQLWTSVSEEFDDYIATPKPNGYQSIHTVAQDDSGRVFEIQIRTYRMHSEAESGGAAHWIYKEGGNQTGGYEQKIAWLRQLLEWQKQLVHDTHLPQTFEKNAFEDRVYVFTPTGDIVDLPIGSTPLDFAYHIHTEIGHRCRGAKVNGKMMPLTYQLKTTDRVEILTKKNGMPSRNWLRSDQSHLKTPSARAKVLQWFKREDEAMHANRGKELLEQELSPISIRQSDLNMAARRMNYAQSDKMFIALGNGNLRLSRVIQVLSDIVGMDLSQPKDEKDFREDLVKLKTQEEDVSKNIDVLGVDHLLSRIAKCCKPVPGDPIVGYITRGQGISIHHQRCPNILHVPESHQNRLIPVNWGMVGKVSYPADLEIILSNKSQMNGLLGIFRDEKIDLVRFNTIPLKRDDFLKIQVTLETNSTEFLEKFILHLNQLRYVISVKRI